MRLPVQEDSIPPFHVSLLYSPFCTSIFIAIVSLHLEVGRFSSRFFVVFFVLEVDDGEMVLLSHYVCTMRCNQ
jgi:hypothetical protein